MEMDTIETYTSQTTNCTSDVVPLILNQASNVVPTLAIPIQTTPIPHGETQRNLVVCISKDVLSHYLKLAKVSN